jgi:hypothetical protein
MIDALHYWSKHKKNHCENFRFFSYRINCVKILKISQRFFQRVDSGLFD